MVQAVRMRTNWVRTMVAGAGAALLLYAGVWSAAQAQTAVDVPIQAFVFPAETLTVPVGTTVTWTNLDPVAHTVTDVNGTYDSGLFDEAVSWSMTFTEPGTYVYYCIPHPMMIGTVEVQ
jgi:plastocyanin